MKSVAVLILLIGTLLVTACARSPEYFGYGSEMSKITVTVTNDNYSDANVYLVRYGGSRTKIGFITGHSGPINFSISASINTKINVGIYVNLFASNKEYTSDSFDISPGQRIELTIGNPLRYSNIIIL